MTGWQAALAGLGTVALGAWAVWLYRRREIPVRGRAVLAGIRAAVLGLVVLLLVNPVLPAGPGGRDRASWVLLDVSGSMERPGVAARAADAVAERGDLPILRFGAPADPGVGPSDGTAGLGEAFERAVEAGARRVVLVSDLRLEEGRSARAVAERLGLEVEVVDVDEPVRSAAVRSFTVPAALGAGAGAGGAVPVEIRIAATAEAAGDSGTVELREEDRLVASRTVALPGAGRAAVLELTVPTPRGEGVVRYEASVTLDGDAWTADDTRVAWTEVDPAAGALVLLALRPDWEPRFLLPVLGEVTGLRTRGLLRVGPDRWLVAEGGDAARTVDDARAVREAENAELLVVQGVGPDAPAGVARAVRSARRVLALASDPAEAAVVGVATSAPVGGEWYVSSPVPPSPIAGELSGASLDGLPPLGPVLPLRGDGDVAVPLRVRRGGTGPGEAAVALVAGDGRRRAVTLAPGHWRWAFRPGRGRDAYRRLWAGLAGWLLADPGASGADVRPVERVVRQGTPVAWSAGAAVGDTVRLSLSRGDSLVHDTAVVVPESGRVASASLPAGLYGWTARWAGGSESSGRLDVTGWSGELLHPRVSRLERAGGSGGGDATAGAGRPLRTHPLPYLVALVLLCAEWVGRRRKGLR